MMEKFAEDDKLGNTRDNHENFRDSKIGELRFRLVEALYEQLCSFT